MRTAAFPRTKEERFLLEVGRQALALGCATALVDWRLVAGVLRYGLKSAQNMVNILARTHLLEKKGSEVKLTAITFRHYCEPLCQHLQIDPPSFDQEEW